MEKGSIVESGILIVLGILGIAESLKLTFQMRPQGVYDVVGPDRYLMAVGIGMVGIGVIFFFSQYKTKPAAKGVPEAKKESATNEHWLKFLSVFGILMIYAFLIDYLGYLLSTIIFFLLVFEALKFSRSWALNILAAIAFGVVLQLIFVNFCDLVFPRGTLLGY